jgi:predicted transposase YdaD
MEYQYQTAILAQLLTHGVRPLPRTRPALVFRHLGDLYRYELRRLKRLRAGGTIPQGEYAGRVVDLRRRYPLVSVPVGQWTVPGTPADPEDVPLC